MKHLSVLNDKYKVELAIIKRHKFGQKHEHLNSLQIGLFDEAIVEDMAAIDQEIQCVQAQHPDAEQPVKPKNQAKRKALPSHLHRLEIQHNPASTVCNCGCELRKIGEDVSEKLSVIPAHFYVERHIRGKWVCDSCETLTQEGIPANVIDKGIASSKLLSHVLISKYADHLPLYRQAEIYKRVGVDIARSTLAGWIGQCGVELQPLVDALRQVLLEQSVLHADETPVSVMSIGGKKPTKGYVWAYATTTYSDVKAVVYDFCEGRAGKYAAEFLKSWQGSLVCDGYAGYKALFNAGVTEVGCMAHARRKFHELHVTKKSTIAIQALNMMQELYAIEAKLADATADQRRRIRQLESKPIMDRLYQWLLEYQFKVLGNSASSVAINYSLKRWTALTRYLEDGELPIDNNWVENQIRPWALGRKNWLFAGSLRSGQRAANIMTLIQLS